MFHIKKISRQSKISSAPIETNPQALFLSVVGVGFSPVAPGTFGTIAALPFLYLLGYAHVSNWLIFAFLLPLAFFASLEADKAQIKYKIHDPSWIVVDEVIGMSVAWLFRSSDDLWNLMVLAVLFRFFDIIKIWPATYFDQKMQHGAGVILDDVVSGIYAGVLCLVLAQASRFF